MRCKAHNPSSLKITYPKDILPTKKFHVTQNNLLLLKTVIMWSNLMREPWLSAQSFFEPQCENICWINMLGCKNYLIRSHIWIPCCIFWYSLVIRPDRKGIGLGVGEDSFEMYADPWYPFVLPGPANVLGGFVIMVCVFLPHYFSVFTCASPWL